MEDWFKFLLGICLIIGVFRGLHYAIVVGVVGILILWIISLIQSFTM